MTVHDAMRMARMSVPHAPAGSPAKGRARRFFHLVMDESPNICYYDKQLSAEFVLHSAPAPCKDC